MPGALGPPGPTLKSHIFVIQAFVVMDFHHSGVQHSEFLYAFEPVEVENRIV